MESDRKAPSNDADADACDDGADDIGEEETEPETVAGLLRTMIAQGACQRLVSLLGSPSTGACTINRPCAQQYVGKYQSCMIISGRLIVFAMLAEPSLAQGFRRPAVRSTRCRGNYYGCVAI